jgi:hypothetical protein
MVARSRSDQLLGQLPFHLELPPDIMSRSNAPTDSVASAVLSLAQIIAEDIDQDRSEVFAWLRPWNSAAREAFDATARTILSKKREFSHFRQFICLEGMMELEKGL